MMKCSDRGHGHCIFLLGSQRKPSQCLRIVLPNSKTIAVEPANTVIRGVRRRSVAFSTSSSVPLHCFDQVLFHPMAILILPRSLAHGGRIAQGRRFFIPEESLYIVLLEPVA